MQITVNRQPSKDDKTLSDVLIDGQFFCYGLEDVIREIPGKPVLDWKIYGKTAIGAGTYPVVINWSGRFKRQMIEIQNVKGFAGVRIHNGKGPESTDGCLIVSMTPEFNYARTAMLEIEKRVMAALVKKEKITIVFNNPVSEVSNAGTK